MNQPNALMVTKQVQGALLSLLLCLLLMPDVAKANPESTFREGPCVADKSCICHNMYFCVKPARKHDVSKVHFRIYASHEYYNVLQKGLRQFEAKYGNLVSVRRSHDGPTMFSVQLCKGTTFGSDCMPYVNFTLNEPTVPQLQKCEAYADKAAATYKQAKTLNCGFKDGYWVEDRNSHYNWCANLADADRNQPDEHTKARQQGLTDCKAKIAAANAPPPPPPPPKNYGGTWEVDLSGAKYTFILTQQGPAITGQIVSADPKRNGTLQASMESDGRAMFSYVQPQLNTGGSGRFWLTETVDKLTGRFSVNGEQALRLLDGCRNSCQDK
jgi:hypothetical protein